MFGDDPQRHVLLAPAVALVAGSLARLWWKVRFRRIATRVDGVTLEPREESDGDGTVYRIRFEYPAGDGRHVRERKNAALTRHRARAGRRVVVLIPPDEPGQGRLLEEFGLMGCVAASLIGFAWIALVFLAYLADTGYFKCFPESAC